MSRKATMTKKKTSSSSSGSSDGLYVRVYDVANKRKSILSAIKNSLIMQEEYEKVMQLRKNKTMLLSEIKKNMSQLNTKYQTLKRHLPNVKNVISYTEKELNAIDSHISSLERNIKSKKEELDTDKKIRENLNLAKEGADDSVKTDKVVEQKVEKETVPKYKPKVPKKGNPVESLSKLDRIKNNLKVIEEKLGDI